MKKGFMLTFHETFSALTMIGLIIIAVFLFRVSYFDIHVLVEGSNEQRRHIVLGQILLSAPELVTVEDGRNIRGVFDPEKLDNVASNPDSLYNNVHYPDTNYTIRVSDLKDVKTWLIEKGNEEGEVVYKKTFPLAIKYSHDKINVGLMELEFYVQKPEPKGPAINPGS